MSTDISLARDSTEFTHICEQDADGGPPQTSVRGFNPLVNMWDR